MGDFLLWSLIASVALTTLFNLLLILFPTSMDRMERRIARIFTQKKLSTDGLITIAFPIRILVLSLLILSVIFNLVLMLNS